MNIKLSKKDFHDANKIAKGRMMTAKSWNLTNQQQDKTRSNADIEKIGVYGEYVVALAYDLNTPDCCGFDDGIDLWFGDKTIQVKTTYYEHGHLLFKAKEKFVADFAVLVAETSCQRTFKIIGATSRKKFYELCFKKDFGNGDIYALHQEDLAKPEIFWRYLIEKKYA